jgi:hypothetical protein
MIFNDFLYVRITHILIFFFRKSETRLKSFHYMSSPNDMMKELSVNPGSFSELKTID